MFSVIARDLCSGVTPDGMLTSAAKLATFLDLAGFITVIVLGVLALCGVGGELITGINTVVPGGAWGTIACGIVGLALLTFMSRRETIIIQQLPQQQELLHTD